MSRNGWYMGIVDNWMFSPLNDFSCGFLEYLLDGQHMGIVSIYMAFHLNAFLNDLLSLRYYLWRHIRIADIHMVYVFSDELLNLKLFCQNMDNAYIYMVFLLDALSGVFLDFLVEQQHMGIGDIYTVFLLNEFLCVF